MRQATKPAKKSEKKIALTVKVSQQDFERLCVLRARTRLRAQEILEKALQNALSKAKV